MQWTEGQRQAIEARNSSVLVSAAAGSGKTAVLVERVLSLLREGGRIDRMLIVRDNLTDEQIKQASELVKKRFESRRDEMMKRRGGEMGRREGGRRGPEGKGPQPGPKAAPEAGNPPPPPPAEAAPAQDAQ